jgi:hypothetical protein
MKKILFVFAFVSLCSMAAVAQDYAGVEKRIKDSIDSNKSEYDRLVKLTQSNLQDRALANLERAHRSKASEIRTNMHEVEGMIQRPAPKDVIDVHMRNLQQLLKDEQALLKRLEALKQSN